MKIFLLNFAQSNAGVSDVCRENKIYENTSKFGKASYCRRIIINSLKRSVKPSLSQEILFLLMNTSVLIVKSEDHYFMIYVWWSTCVFFLVHSSTWHDANGKLHSNVYFISNASAYNRKDGYSMNIFLKSATATPSFRS